MCGVVLKAVIAFSVKSAEATQTHHTLDSVRVLTSDTIKKTANTSLKTVLDTCLGCGKFTLVPADYDRLCKDCFC